MTERHPRMMKINNPPSPLYRMAIHPDLSIYIERSGTLSKPKPKVALWPVTLWSGGMAGGGPLARGFESYFLGNAMKAKKVTPAGSCVNVW